MNKHTLIVPALLVALAACSTPVPPPTATALPKAPTPAPTVAPAPTATAAPPTAVPTAIAPTVVPIAARTQVPVPTVKPAAGGCIANFDANTDYFSAQAELKYASNFTVDYFKSYKVVTVSNPWRGAKEKFTYVLVQCGAPTPANVPAGAQVIEIPAKRMISFDTPFVPGFDALGMLDRLVGVDSFKYVNNETVRKMIKEGKLAEVADPELNIEKVIAARADFIMTSATGGEFDSHPKLLAAKQKVVLNASYMEQLALARTEWVKFNAVFFNKEAEATAEFDKIESAYNAIAQKMAKAAKKPTSFSGLPFKDTWSIAGGQSFAAQWFADAGTNYLWADDKSVGSIPLKFEQVLAKAGNADVWLVNGFGITDKASLLKQDARYGNFAAVKNGNIWNNDLQVNENGGNNFFELGAHRPDLVLADVAKIAHPDLMQDHKFVFYRQIK